MPQNPNNGPAHGRFRKTMNSQYGDVRKANPFPLGPIDRVTQGLERQQLGLARGVQMASLKQQARDIRAQARYNKQGIISQGRAGLSEAAGAANDRGMLGSTVAAVAEQEVRGSIGAGLAENFTQRQQGLVGVAQGKLEAITAHRMGLIQQLINRAAQQREMALRAFGSGGQNPWGY